MALTNRSFFRMESTGKPSMIQISQQTAQCLNDAGMGQAVSPREDKVAVKGKVSSP